MLFEHQRFLINISFKSRAFGCEWTVELRIKKYLHSEVQQIARINGLFMVPITSRQQRTRKWTHMLWGME